MTNHILRIATRTSNLARWQAEHIADRLRQTSDSLRVELVPIRTQGDGNQTTPLRDFGGIGVFTKAVQLAVLDGQADLAVHSLKDLPTTSTVGLTLAGVPDRAVRADVLVLSPGNAVASLAGLPPCARVGTGSPRRQAQLLHFRDDLVVAEIRGNVETRLGRLDAGEFDAIVLAEAGLTRLGLTERISLRLEPPTMYPAIGQGALGIECREDDKCTRAALAEITDAPTLASATAERALLRRLRAGCHAPLGAWSDISEDRLSLTGVLLSTDGVVRLEASAEGSSNEGESIGAHVARQLLAAGGDRIVGNPASA